MFFCYLSVYNNTNDKYILISNNQILNVIDVDDGTDDLVIHTLVMICVYVCILRQQTLHTAKDAWLLFNH